MTPVYTSSFETQLLLSVLLLVACAVLVAIWTVQRVREARRFSAWLEEGKPKRSVNPRIGERARATGVDDLQIENPAAFAAFRGRR